MHMFTKMANKTSQHALSFKVIKRCPITKARVSQLTLPHAVVQTPIFMPVGTQGTMKGLIPEQIEELKCNLILANTYHLGMRPGTEVLKKAGGLHKFMNWKNGLLTDSGGFQMVSLIKLSELTEEGVKFTSPYDQKEIMLTPEKSMEIQNCIGADIMMQLDDVVSSLVTGPRVEEAMHRTLRWIDRCLEAHQAPEKQSIFPIVQGGLNRELREQCAKELTKRDVAGFAVGGLSGGEEKDQFWRMVDVSTDHLPNDKPRYLMGVGFAIDLVVCAALGCDMFDCVYPTRTARFGAALVSTGQLNLKNRCYANDFQPIDSQCDCLTCQRHTRAYLYHIVTKQTVACHLVSIHNLRYQMRLMNDIRTSILEDRFPEYVQEFMATMHPDGNYPEFAVNALAKVNIELPIANSTKKRKTSTS